MDNALKIREESAAVPVELETFMAQALQLMQGMADMVRATNERMAALEQQVRMLEKVTPSQATDLNAAIRQRAAAACQEYRMTGMEMLPPELYQLSRLPAVTTPHDVATVVLSVLAICTLAAVVPAWRAASLDPVEALRYE